MSQARAPTRGQRQSGGDQKRPRPPQEKGQMPRKPPQTHRSPSRPPPYQSNSTRQTRSVPQEQNRVSKWTYICSRRGIVLMCTVLTNVLVLICVVASLMVVSGMSSMGGLAGGSFSIDTAYTPFEGVELQQVRDLDMRYSQMRAPGVYGGVAFSLVCGVLSLFFVVSGNKPPHLQPWKRLVAQFVFQAVGGVAYVVAVALYLHFVILVNSTDTCQQRASLYARRGYNWMNCQVGGGDAAVALFGLITAILYGVGAVLSGITARRVRRYLQEREQKSQRDELPLASDITAV